MTDELSPAPRLLIAPGDGVLIPIFGRFGYLPAEIAGRCRAEVRTVVSAWGTGFAPERIEAAVRLGGVSIAQRA